MPAETVTACTPSPSCPPAREGVTWSKVSGTRPCRVHVRVCVTRRTCQPHSHTTSHRHAVLPTFSTYLSAALSSVHALNQAARHAAATYLPT
eukprot:366307-Chlamydomonas_euryale.AAC.11